MRRQRPEQVAYWDSSRSITYAKLAKNTAAIAANLAKAGVGEGDRIAIYLPNGVDWIEACFAGLRAGAVDRSHQLRRGGGRDQLSTDGCQLRACRHDARQEGAGREDLRATPASRPE